MKINEFNNDYLNEVLDKLSKENKITFLLGAFNINLVIYSHKKKKDSLEGSLVRVLFSAEVEFSKILVPRLP